jgi:hypothetical protein
MVDSVEEGVVVNSRLSLLNRQRQQGHLDRDLSGQTLESTGRLAVVMGRRLQRRGHRRRHLTLILRDLILISIFLVPVVRARTI